MTRAGSCDCGATEFEVTAAPTGNKRCTCSIRSKLGVLWVYSKPEDFKLQERPGCEATCRWNSKSVASKFCPAFGCSTYAETFG